MSAIIETLLQCDGCGYVHAGSADNRGKKMPQHRIMVKLDGWSYKKGKDYCVDCVNKEKDNKGG